MIPRHRHDLHERDSGVRVSGVAVLLAGGVGTARRSPLSERETRDDLEAWIDYKTNDEILPIQLRPHPHEFELYYDI